MLGGGRGDGWDLARLVDEMCESGRSGVYGGRCTLSFCGTEGRRTGYSQPGGRIPMGQHRLRSLGSMSGGLGGSDLAEHVDSQARGQDPILSRAANLTGCNAH